MSRSLILAGGGMRVAWQAGVLLALEEAGLHFAHGDGTSGGIFNLAMLLSGQTPRQMCERWRTVPVKEFAALLPVEEYLRPGDQIALGSAAGVRNVIFPHLGIDAARINAHDGRQGMVGAGSFNVCNFTRKTNEAIPHDGVDADLLVAGVSLPVFTPPVAKNGQLYMDSVWIKDANLMEAVRRGADELWLLWCIGNTGKYHGGAFRQYVHMIELSANGALFEEFARIKEMARPVRLHVIKPEYPLPLDPEFFLGRIDAATLINRGYADAKRYLRTRAEPGVALEPEATQMRESPPGILFRETLSGTLSLDGAEPAPATLHAAVQIRDLDRFLSVAGAEAEVHAHLDFGPLGGVLPAVAGRFRYAAAPARRMVYELEFEHQGRPLFFTGESELQTGGFLRLWRQVMTMRARLHQGRDASGPVVATGEFQMRADDIARTVASVHATDTGNVVESAKMIARFGRFFLGEAWETAAAFSGRS